MDCNGQVEPASPLTSAQNPAQSTAADKAALRGAHPRPRPAEAPENHLAKVCAQRSVRQPQHPGNRYSSVCCSAVSTLESNPTTWRLAAMNLAIRGMDFNLGKEPSDTFARDLPPDLKAQFILANPPFNVSDWGGDELFLKLARMGERVR